MICVGMFRDLRNVVRSICFFVGFMVFFLKILLGLRVVVFFERGYKVFIYWYSFSVVLYLEFVFLIMVVVMGLKNEVLKVDVELNLFF